MGLAQFSRTLSRELLDLLFPVTCVGCGTHREDLAAADRWLCETCRTRVLPDRPPCLACGAAAPTGRTCFGCREKTPLTGLVSVGRYSDPILNTAIKRFKFQGIRALAEPLGDLLARRIAATGLAVSTQQSAVRDVRTAGTAKVSPALVPLPLHPRRERWRGCNQARLLADAVGRRLEVPVRELLTRTRATSPQTSILKSPRARRANVAGAFQLSTQLSALSTQHIILVDDVLTTGATMTETARVLKAAGALEVWAAVVARG